MQTKCFHEKNRIKLDKFKTRQARKARKLDK